MTAAAIAPARTEAEPIVRGWVTFRRVMNSEWPAGTGDGIRESLEGLMASLETYRDVLGDITHPASAYPELECEDDAFSLALGKAAEDAGEWAAELNRLVPVVMCRAHPDDCPNGPEPHPYYNPEGPVETWTHCCCCVQPGEATP